MNDLALQEGADPRMVTVLLHARCQTRGSRNLAISIHATG
jgi:hypothetical protein